MRIVGMGEMESTSLVNRRHSLPSCVGEKGLSISRSSGFSREGEKYGHVCEISRILMLV